MLILSAVFLTLLTAWLLWGWIVAEARDYKFMKLWCARSFVVLAALLSLGAGAFVAHRRSQQMYRESITRFATVLNRHAQSGNTDDVTEALHRVADAHDEWTTLSPDILVRIREVTDQLEKPGGLRTAGKPAGNGTQVR